jgi:hypothetical protein
MTVRPLLLSRYFRTHQKKYDKVAIIEVEVISTTVISYMSEKYKVMDPSASAEVTSVHIKKLRQGTEH